VLNALISKVESTPGLVMTDNGLSVISPPYKSDQESCCEKALQNFNFPFIVNTSSSFNVLSSIALIKQ